MRKGGQLYIDRFCRSYPLEGTQPTTFFLPANGSLSPTRPSESSTISYSSEYPVEGPVKQIAEKAFAYVTGYTNDGRHVRFTSPPLDADLELLGRCGCI